MYLTIKQHDLFRTLLMGFEIPFRAYIAKTITTAYATDNDFEAAMKAKKALLTPTSPQFLRDTLPKACKGEKLKATYAKFVTATSSTDEIVTTDIEVPMVGALNLATFALTENFGDLYSLFGAYNAFCVNADLYCYARNKLNHPGCRTLEDSHLVPVVSFVKDICNFLDDCYFLQKSKEVLLKEVSVLQNSRPANPIKIHNFSELPYGDSRIVCRDAEIERIKSFVYGKPDDLRKQHSLCIYGYGGVGKTALVLETMKQIVRDIQDETVVNDYDPRYMLFFSAKKRKLSLAAETGKFVEQQMRYHFQSADELIELIKAALNITSFRKFRDEGLIVIDNLETLTPEEREKIKTFVETGTHSEVQFILTSRNSEEYETNFKLAGFNAEAGIKFIQTYSEENSLDISLNEEDAGQLVSLAKGNTLVLVLSLRRLSKKLATVGSLTTEFSSSNAWKRIRSTLSKTPSNAYEVVAEFMYKDTFEHIETAFAENADLFYKVLKVFAVTEADSIDINTICMLTQESYPSVEEVIAILCNFLIIEKKDMQYSLNTFADKYIVGRFIPDSDTYDRLSMEIASRQRQVRESLEKLMSDMEGNDRLSDIMKDWMIITEVDRVAAAEMYKQYGEIQKACNESGRFSIEGVFATFEKKCNESEGITAHPYIKFQKAKILQLVDKSNKFPEKHTTEIKRAFGDARYNIKTIEQYAGIQQTKSYASLLWFFGQYLAEIDEMQEAIRYLEESKLSFEELNNHDQQYYQCSSQLATLYLEWYKQDRENRKAYLRKAREICKMLSENWGELGKARKYAGQLKTNLRAYGKY